MRKLNASLITIITLLVLGTPSALSQRTSVGRQFPVYDNGGKPDLTIDPQRFTSQMEIIDRLFDEGTCAVEEGAVGGTGYRRILRFDTVVMNGGDGDLIVGDRSDPNNPYAAYFVFAPCHGHYHIRDFSVYELLDTSGTTVVAGHKQGFCFEDSFKYAGNRSNGYSCAYQGITSGWGDWYYKQLTGQWIDITGVPEGDYIVRVTINLIGIFDEGQNRYPNVVQTPIHVPSPRKKVDIDNSPALVDN
jgi:Lysyl oxidase